MSRLAVLPSTEMKSYKYDRETIALILCVQHRLGTFPVFALVREEGGLAYLPSRDGTWSDR